MQITGELLAVKKHLHVLTKQHLRTHIAYMHIHTRIDKCDYKWHMTCAQIVDGLVSCEAPSLDSFEWLRQVRHYWDNDTEVLYVAFAQVGAYSFKDGWKAVTAV